MTFLLPNVALAFYIADAIRAHDADIFRSWRLVSSNDFQTI